MGPARFIRNAVSSDARPVTVTEFANALFKRWTPQGQAQATIGKWKGSVK
jgi:hypothetical protein